MSFSKARRQHRRQPSWLKLATQGASPYMASPGEQSPWSSTQYQFAAAEASAYEDIASPTTLDEIGYAKKNDLQIEEAPLNTAKHDPTFATSGLDKYYRPVAGYEGMHRYDPDFEWEPEEEKRIVRKVCCHASQPNRDISLLWIPSWKRPWRLAPRSEKHWEAMQAPNSSVARYGLLHSCQLRQICYRTRPGTFVSTFTRVGLCFLVHLASGARWCCTLSQNQWKLEQENASLSH